MKILILGANGMIGHKIYQMLSAEFNDTWVAFRKYYDELQYKDIFNKEKAIENIDFKDFNKLNKIIKNLDPDIIVNAAGITIRRGVNNNISNSILLNAALPHFLEEWVQGKTGKRLIHFSTDCVFSGIKGPYTEESETDAKDNYGKTKALGEVKGSQTLTLRGSMIGRELANHTELLEWFLSQNGKTVKGFSNVIYSGITTIKMAEIVKKIIFDYPTLNGLYHVSSLPISKYDLLVLFRNEFNLDIEIIKDESYYSRKDLIAENFYQQIDMLTPKWEDLIKNLKIDSIINKKYYKN